MARPAYWGRAYPLSQTPNFKSSFSSTDSYPHTSFANFVSPSISWYTYGTSAYSTLSAFRTMWTSINSVSENNSYVSSNDAPPSHWCITDRCAITYYDNSGYWASTSSSGVTWVISCMPKTDYSVHHTIWSALYYNTGYSRYETVALVVQAGWFRNYWYLCTYYNGSETSSTNVFSSSLENWVRIAIQYKYVSSGQKQITAFIYSNADSNVYSGSCSIQGRLYYANVGQKLMGTTNKTLYDINNVWYGYLGGVAMYRLTVADNDGMKNLFNLGCCTYSISGDKVTLTTPRLFYKQTFSCSGTLDDSTGDCYSFFNSEISSSPVRKYKYQIPNTAYTYLSLYSSDYSSRWSPDTYNYYLLADQRVCYSFTYMSGIHAWTITRSTFDAYNTNDCTKIAYKSNTSNVEKVQYKPLNSLFGSMMPKVVYSPNGGVCNLMKLNTKTNGFTHVTFSAYNKYLVHWIPNYLVDLNYSSSYAIYIGNNLAFKGMNKFYAYIQQSYYVAGQYLTGDMYKSSSGSVIMDATDTTYYSTKTLFSSLKPLTITKTASDSWTIKNPNTFSVTYGCYWSFTNGAIVSLGTLSAGASTSMNLQSYLNDGVITMGCQYSTGYAPAPVRIPT